MAVIDVGPGATNRGSNYSTLGRTIVDLNNPANDTGTLDSFEIFANSSNLSNAKIGSFYGNSTNKIVRDYESIGSVTASSKQTFTGKNCDVESGDYLGLYWNTSGAIERDTSSYSGIYLYTGDGFDGSHIYSLTEGDAISIYATGTTVAAGSLLTSLFRKPFRHMLIR